MTSVSNEFLYRPSREHGDDDEDSSEYDNFTDLAKKLVNVPKKDIDAKRTQEKP
jgi:hypothetical protein